MEIISTLGLSRTYFGLLGAPGFGSDDGECFYVNACLVRALCSCSFFWFA